MTVAIAKAFAEKEFEKFPVLQDWAYQSDLDRLAAKPEILKEIELRGEDLPAIYKKPHSNRQRREIYSQYILDTGMTVPFSCTVIPVFPLFHSFRWSSARISS